MADDPDPTRTVDEALLRYLGRVLGRQQEVSGTMLFPANKQETLLVSLNSAYYPELVDEVWLELRVYTNGEFHVAYLEDFGGDLRRCRWDRHEQDHNTRDHFHPLPVAATADAEDREFPPEVTALLETVVLPWVDSRLGEIWEE